MDVYVQPVQRIIVKFLVAEGCSGAEIHHCLLAVFKTLWRARVFEWFSRFRSRRQSGGDDSRGVILVDFDFVPSGSTVNADYNSALLSDRLCDCPAVRQKRPNVLRKGVILQRDNAAPHNARRTVEKVAVMGRKLLQHPPYIPDWVRGHSTSLKLVPFKSLGTVSYSASIVTMAVSVADCEIFNVKKWCDLGNGVI